MIASSSVVKVVISTLTPYFASNADDDVGADVGVVVEDLQRTGLGFQAVLDRARSSCPELLVVVAACLQQRQTDGQGEAQTSRASDYLSTCESDCPWSSPRYERCQR